MTRTYLMSAIPNALMIPNPNEAIVLVGISENQAKELLTTQWGFISAVGHESTAKLLQSKLKVPIIHNRITVEVSKDDIIVVAAFIPPRRLGENELWTEEELLSFNIRYAKVMF